MATIQKRRGERGVSYTATIRRKGLKSLTATFRRRGDAAAWAAKIEDQILGRKYRDPRMLDGVTLGELLDRYTSSVSTRKRPSTCERELRTARSLKRHLGKKAEIADIQADRVAAFRDARLKTVSAYTVRIELAMLSHLFRIARKEWLLPVENPVEDIERPSPPAGRERYLTDTEARILLDKCREVRDPMLFPYVLILLHSAMRPSEAASITWDQVNLGERYIHLGITKNGTPRRPPLSKTVVEVLGGLSTRETGGFVFLTEPTKRKAALVVPSQHFRESWESAREAARKEAGDSFRGFRLHDLRHTAASHLLKAGAVDLITLAAILGHSSMNMVQRYAHLLPGRGQAAVDTIKGLGF